VGYQGCCIDNDQQQHTIKVLRLEKYDSCRQQVHQDKYPEIHANAYFVIVASPGEVDGTDDGQYQEV
jgi:hypothetical protein